MNGLLADLVVGKRRGLQSRVGSEQSLRFRTYPVPTFSTDTRKSTIKMTPTTLPQGGFQTFLILTLRQVIFSLNFSSKGSQKSFHLI